MWAEEANDPPVSAYRSTVSEVRLTFFATDESNHPVETLGKDDFAIVDGDMVVRDFRSLSHSSETALDVLVVVDASESVASDFQTTVSQVREVLSRTQLASDENLSVVSFAGLQAAQLCAGDCRTSATSEKLLALRSAGATPLFDALAYSADFIAKRRQPGVRPVLVLFSDGDDTISKISGRDALDALIASGAVLYAIDMSQPGDASRGSARLRKMAEATGGRYFSPRDDAANVLEAALDDLRASYVVSYPLPNSAQGFHALRILPKHNLHLQFHCRNGYFYGTNP